MTDRRKITRTVTIELEAGGASMVELGKMLGPTGVNIRQVKSEFDERTAGQRGDVVPAVVTIYEDRTHALRLKTPPTAFLIRRTLGIKSGARRPGHDVVGELTQAQLREIAERKLPDLNTDDLAAAMRTVAGTARSMGVRVV
ncbi:50S ribosomal protein L11 [Dactylosporangium sp. AC04546]|uniref:uL11 family ribosomal protein n=1 Tax=Dactylosporangium sp. AC04546 TaxID=2862460 RepID=UPI001EDE0622|nr:50S ribosomal protein L11 [Dactylosporangium sp. AC04546]WVK85643.1 50S ribosomal protein L11 [Dactylosporangium sp. AC04546]